MSNIFLLGIIFFAENTKRRQTFSILRKGQYPSSNFVAASFAFAFYNNFVAESLY